MSETKTTQFSPELEQILQELNSPIYRNQAEWMKQQKGCSDEEIMEFLNSLP